MKKLLTTLLFIGMFSQVSLSQIWESDTIPSNQVVKRFSYSWLSSNYNLNLIRITSTSPSITYNIGISNNFGNSFTNTGNQNCCMTSVLRRTGFPSSFYPLSGDTFFSVLKIPMYQLDHNLFNAPSSNDAAIFFNLGNSMGNSIGGSWGIRYYSAISGGYRNISLNFLRSAYLFSSTKAIITLTTKDGLAFRRDRDTISRVLIWQNGAQLVRSQIQTKFPILDYEFVNNNAIGYCGGYAGYLGKTIDQGLNWTKLNPPIKADWEDLVFADSLNGWAYGQILKDTIQQSLGATPVAIYTPDGGNTWFQIACDTNFVWRKKWFNSQGFGWALRDGRNNGPSQLVKTTDYGNSWTVQLSTTTERFEEMYFVDSSNALIFANFRNLSNSLPSKIYIKTSSTLGTFKKYLPKLELYPNPTSGKFRLRGYKEEEGLTLRIFSNSGKEVWRGIPSPEGEVDISQLSPGLYHVEALTTSGKRWSTRVVRE